MASKVTEFAIGELRFSTVAPMPVQGYRLSARLAPIFLPVIAAAHSAKASGATSDAELLPLIAGVFSRLEGPAADQLLIDAFCTTSVTAPIGEGGKLVRLDLSSVDLINRAFEGAGLMALFGAMLRAFGAMFADVFAMSGIGAPAPKA
jgi:hypothetical protein